MSLSSSHPNSVALKSIFLPSVSWLAYQLGMLFKLLEGIYYPRTLHFCLDKFSLRLQSLVENKLRAWVSYNHDKFDWQLHECLLIPV